MRGMVCTLVVVLALGAWSTASADSITAVGPFTGTLSEGFEGLPSGFLSQHSVFGGAGVWQSSSFVHVTGGWVFFSTIHPHSGRLFGGAGSVSEYVFDVPAQAFGGYFGTNSDADDGVARFFDVDDNLIGVRPITAPKGGSWTWNGWVTSVGFKRIEIEGNSIIGSGGHLQMDDMEYNPVPEGSTLVLVGAALVALAWRRRTRPRD